MVEVSKLNPTIQSRLLNTFHPFKNIYWKLHLGNILHLHYNGVCLRLCLASAPHPTPYFWSENI